VFAQNSWLNSSRFVLTALYCVCLQMVELSKSQDIEAGDGTTSVVVLAGGLLNACSTLLTRGIHPNQISDAFQLAALKADEIMKGMAIPVDFNDRETLVKCTTTSLCSKVNTSASIVTTCQNFCSAFLPLTVQEDAYDIDCVCCLPWVCR
jgi:chaperonin GroEL (HSP60 family)